MSTGEHAFVCLLFFVSSHENPNLFSIGEGFGFFVFFGNENAAVAQQDGGALPRQAPGSFPTAVCPKPYQKKRVTKVTTVKVP